MVCPHLKYNCGSHWSVLFRSPFKRESAVRRALWCCIIESTAAFTLRPCYS